MIKANANRTILTCTCENTMSPDEGALAKAGCAAGGSVNQLCRANLDNFRAALAKGLPVTVACTQEAPLFSEVAADEAPDLPLSFANIRETAGWTAQAATSGPKMAAMIAAAAVAPAPFGVTTLDSTGVTLILGRDEVAIEAADALSEHLDITVLMQPGSQITPPMQTRFPVLQGRIRTALGHLGAFTLTVDDYAAPSPSSREVLKFEAARDGAVSRADLVVDLTGTQPLFAAHDLRPGYLRADPKNPRAVADLIAKAGQMVGTFDKPVYIDFLADLCAHSRNGITGCTRCLSLCPTGAITPNGDSVQIDPAICAGCGQCAAACPTGAAAYALPDVATVAARLRAALKAWHDAGGTTAPVILLHDADHGEPLINASGRYGNGLPAHVIPLGLNEITQAGPEVLAAAFAYGAGAVALLGRAKPLHDVDGLRAGIELVTGVAEAMGHGPVTLIETDDPDALEAALDVLPKSAVHAAPSSFLPPADKRGLLVMAFAEMNRAAPKPAQTLPLPQGAPFGSVTVDPEACTLCQACTGVCPTGALLDNPETPMLRFTESACVQCGLCAATCPETAITLTPQLDFAAWDTPRRILHEEPPFCCTVCGEAFATRSGIDRVKSRLVDHWMFQGETGAARLKVLSMCEDCRVQEIVNQGFDPHGETIRKVRTQADYGDGYEDS
ncbi:4Fe-4S ferredoxin iron-sulfur binding domain protein [Dinoroseobacter shibae DFL 12 = DSM 16493]|jgi:ferredoxin|uniref:4Fe-4S ferredoxin iron-sulfur binding domain protein n=2 Tax=Dinoroseobacter shibae TaxID=215813 RepID=A8LNT6_DINSH|nr:4Fe-4S dicluster domain-containing protein [Dinoroseobacter shibae]ABV92244.1 4Fe-4S ferredoxin iron-sulfur binding domain protein [Dinoroseobacter shibae DFL 12 = DSM 16493]URF47195.1 4Fe-4S binding protein [Dinoroseobacter shibae]URF51506.1 4Fe-4S binding protein [Dinoroseobacter shibae]